VFLSCKGNTSEKEMAGISLVYAEKGSFAKGVKGDTKNPEQIVSIKQDFWISKYEITQQQYNAVMDTNPSVQPGEKHPVENVSWYDAVLFCETLNRDLSKTGKLPEGYEFRLPTSTEWEYAAKGGINKDTFSYAGSNELDIVAWYRNNSEKKHHRVGQKKPNALGLYDMSGNVWEWCADSLPENQSGKPGQSTRIKKGGAFFNDAGTLKLNNTGEMDPNGKGVRFGFRVVFVKKMNN
jgi:formylglycine-generating enzyme required for sulfatase activity